MLLQIGRTRNAVSTDTPQRDIEMLYARAASSYPIDIDAKVKLYDGRWLQIRERRTAAGNIVGIHSDITKMQTALEEIKTLKGFFRKFRKFCTQPLSSLIFMYRNVLSETHHLWHKFAWPDF